MDCNRIDWREFAAKWPSPVVARTELDRFSGGLLNCRTEANRDSLGVGIPGRFRVGRKICYPVKAVIQYMRERASEA